MSDQAITQITAHNFGVTGYAALTPESPVGRYFDLPEVLDSTWDHRYYCSNERPECAYRLLEYNKNDNESVYPYFTNRTITASSGPCYLYNQTSQELLDLDDGKQAVWNYTYTNGTHNGSIIIPYQMEALSGTTYVYRGRDVPQQESTWSYGDRGMWIWAHKSPDEANGPGSTFFQCPIDIGQVNNASQPEHEIPNDIARLAAASIALQGRNQDGPDTWSQDQFYPIG